MNTRLRYPLSLRWRLLLPLVVTAVIISILLFVTMRQVTKQAVQATQDALLSTAVSSILQQTRSRDSNVDIDLPSDIFTKDQLTDRLLTISEAVTENAIEVYIGRIRKKLTGCEASIETIRGLGYKMVIA